jgi:hypothetical protein
MDKKIGVKFLSVIQPFCRESDSRISSRKQSRLNFRPINRVFRTKSRVPVKNVIITFDVLIPPLTQEVTSLRDPAYMVWVGYRYRSHDSSPVAIALKSAAWWRCSKPRSTLDWVTRSLFWRFDREWGTHLRVNLQSSSSRARTSFTVDTLKSKWLAIFFAEANGYLERNLDKTTPKIVSSLPDLFLSSHDVSPSLKRHNYRFTLGRDTASSPRVPRKWVCIALLPCSCSQRTLMQSAAPVRPSVHLNVISTELLQ